jgi:2-C-methyl-D-erythritol 4-phosphate cytidylyltransferase/2-C-methyl-D-erythritol 2,4-cyclodiphosphate synthase
MKNIAIIVSAGIGKRFGSPDKVFFELKGKPLFIWAVEPFEKSEKIDSIWLVTRKDAIKKVEKTINKFNIKKIKKIIEGGKERQDSVYNALKSLPSDTDIVLIHDAARPMVTQSLVERVIDAVNFEVDGVIPAISLTDTIKWTKKGNIIGGTLNREILKAVQTPQAFWFKNLIKAYERAYNEGFYGTDDASLIERYGGKILSVQGDENNIKVTTREDLKKLEFAIQGCSSIIMNESLLNSLRIGIGYDSHKFVEKRKLIIGGVEIPYNRGLYGHSDADVLIHAIIDAILGSAGAGDIGTHFPDSDPLYKDISSIVLLEKTLQIASSKKVKPLWIDCIIFAEKPKMSPYIPKMRENIQKFGINISIKAKTNEGMGFIGRQEGIAAQAICLSSMIL